MTVFTAKVNGRWSICDVWRAPWDGPNPGAVQVDHRPIRWWHPLDVAFFILDLAFLHTHNDTPSTASDGSDNESSEGTS